MKCEYKFNLSDLKKITFHFNQNKVFTFNEDNSVSLNFRLEIHAKMKRQKSCLLLSLAVTLCLAGTSLLLAFGFMFLKPYMIVQHLTRSICSLTTIRDQSPYIPCTCMSADEDCVSYFPCLHLYVDVTMESGQIIQNVTFYDQLDTYLQMHSTNKVGMIDMSLRMFT